MKIYEIFYYAQLKIVVKVVAATDETIETFFSKEAERFVYSPYELEYKEIKVEGLENFVIAPKSPFEKTHICPYCNVSWVCGYPRGCKADTQSLCVDHDNKKCRDQLGGKWAE